jgi:hypothetical protein
LSSRLGNGHAALPTVEPWRVNGMPRVLVAAGSTSRYVPAMYRTSPTSNSSSTNSGAAAAASRNAAIDGNDDADESKTSTVSRNVDALEEETAAPSHADADASSVAARS